GAVLPGAGLGDHPALSPTRRQQGLADLVVDLVGAGVREVLALEIDAAADPVRQAPREVERRRPPDEVAQQRIELGPKALVPAGLVPRRRQLVEGGDQDLRHEPAAVRPEPLVDRGERHQTPPATEASALAACARAANAAIRAWSFIPRADS